MGLVITNTDEPVMISNDVADDGKPESAAFLFRRKIGFEHPNLRLSRDSGSVIGDFQAGDLENVIK